MVLVTHNKQKRSAIVAMVLGDAYLRSQGSLTITHCAAQKNYLEMKCGILQTKQKAELKVIDFDNHGFPGCYLETRVRPIYRVLRKWIYKNGIKTISRKILEYLDPLGLAIWYQDDGSLSAKKRNGKIHSYDLTLNTYLSKEQNELIIAYFLEKWSIKWGLSKSKGKYRLRMGVQEGRKFVKIIEPYVIPELRYKIEPLIR
jgi:hypothetical protein